MSGFKSFEEIIGWQKARLLCGAVYKVTYKEAFKKDFGLVDQVRRASVSVMAYIAEGYDRRGDKEFVRFLNIARGSLSEVKSHLFIALDLKYINEKEKIELFLLIDEIGKLINGLSNYLTNNTKKKS
jgi:four helix bundle protein